MSNKILVTYASRAGSTAGVAEAIGRTLGESGEQVDVLPMQEVHDLSPYRAVVAGSAIQNKQWLPEALQFIHIHQVALSQKPFAAFLVCMTMAMKNAAEYEKFVSDFLVPLRSVVKPVSEGLFAGVLDIKKSPPLLTASSSVSASSSASGRRAIIATGTQSAVGLRVLSLCSVPDRLGASTFHFRNLSPLALLAAINLTMELPL